MLAEPSQFTTWPLPVQSPQNIQQRHTIWTIKVSVSIKNHSNSPYLCLNHTYMLSCSNFMFFRLQNLEINQYLVHWSLVASGLSVRKNVV